MTMILDGLEQTPLEWLEENPFYQRGSVHARFMAEVIDERCWVDRDSYGEEVTVHGDCPTSFCLTSSSVDAMHQCYGPWTRGDTRIRAGSHRDEDWGACMDTVCCPPRWRVDCPHGFPWNPEYLEGFTDQSEEEGVVVYRLQESPSLAL